MTSKSEVKEIVVPGFSKEYLISFESIKKELMEITEKNSLTYNELRGIEYIFDNSIDKINKTIQGLSSNPLWDSELSYILKERQGEEEDAVIYLATKAVMGIAVLEINSCSEFVKYSVK